MKGKLRLSASCVAATQTVPITAYVESLTPDPNTNNNTATAIIEVSSLGPSPISPSNMSFAANGGTGQISVDAAGDCEWAAGASSSFITVTDGRVGFGDGLVTYAVAPNTAPTNRVGIINVAGQTFTVYQGAHFNDVPEGAPFYNEIGRLSARGVTLGCGNGNYCPNDPVLREQMAAFIIRALGDFNPPTPPDQRFADVPPSNPFYNFIDALAVRQVTLGCGGGNYCPTDPVLREQMAAFLIRALGEFNPPTPPFQRFNDVPPSNSFYSFIDRLAVLNITMGCSANPPLFCPASEVTRAQMAAFLVRAFNL